jgi:hypothetical protein
MNWRPCGAKRGGSDTAGLADGVMKEAKDDVFATYRAAMEKSEINP